MRGRIGRRGGSCGGKIYRGLPGLEYVLLKMSIEAFGIYMKKECQLAKRPIVVPLGAEKLHKKKEELRNSCISGLHGIFELAYSKRVLLYTYPF